MDVNPSVRKAVGELATLLDEYGYSPCAREAIVRYTVANGTPSGCPALDREDEHDASMVFEAELEPVPFDSPAWDRDGGVYLDVALLAENRHPTPFPAEPPDVGYGQAPDESWFHPHRHSPNGANGLPPVRGGSEEAGRFEPSEQDWRDYREHFDRAGAPEAPFGYE
jgi:hypothetical protein